MGAMGGRSTTSLEPFGVPVTSCVLTIQESGFAVALGLRPVRGSAAEVAMALALFGPTVPLFCSTVALGCAPVSADGSFSPSGLLCGRLLVGQDLGQSRAGVVRLAQRCFSKSQVGAGVLVVVVEDVQHGRSRTSQRE